MFTKENATELASLIKASGYESAENAIDMFLTLCESRDYFATPRKAGSGRKDGLTKKKVVEILRIMEGGEDTVYQEKSVPRAYLERIVKMGYLVKIDVLTGKRGRPPVEYVLTGKGRGYLALSKNWKL